MGMMAMEKGGKPIKRVKGPYIIEMPFTGEMAEMFPEKAWNVTYYDTAGNGWIYGFTQCRQDLYRHGGLPLVLDELGYSLQCASDIVNNFRNPEELRIIDTDSGDIVNPLPTIGKTDKRKTKVVAIDIFGNEYVIEP